MYIIYVYYIYVYIYIYIVLQYITNKCMYIMCRYNIILIYILSESNDKHAEDSFNLFKPWGATTMTNPG